MVEKNSKRYTAKSVMIGRKPRIGDNCFKTAVISLFNKNNPHKCGEIPIKTIDYPNIEKIRLKDLVNVSYYLEGNDLVINDLEDVEIENNGTFLVVRGTQRI